MGLIETDHERLEKELLLRTALVSLTNELLSAGLTSGFYQTALERTVELVPDAHAGSVLIRGDDGFFHFVAAVEFDFHALERIRLSDAEMGARAETHIEKIDIQDYEDRLGEDKIAMFGNAGKLNDIRATLSVPLTVGDRIMGYFNLDNFESQDAFREQDIGFAEAIAAQVSVALQRLFLERRLQEEREHFERMAYEDALTGLPNRRFFLEFLKRSLANASRRHSCVGVLYIDMDGFKGINDVYGHHVGDHVLLETGRRIDTVLRSGDVSARLGGDEFGVILMDVTDALDTRRVGEKIAHAVFAPVELDNESLHPQVSVGCATFPEDGIAIETLLKRADSGMYEIKSTHRT